MLKHTYLAWIAGLSVLLAVGAALAAAGPERLKPGLWKITTTMGKMPAQTSQRCLTAQDAATANGPLSSIRSALDAENRKNGCTTGTVTVDGSRVSFTMTCGASKSVSDNQYQGTTSSGTMVTAMPNGQSMTMSTKGTRVGNCK